MLVGSMQTNQSLMKRSKRENDDTEDVKSCEIHRKASETINIKERNKDSHQHKRTSNGRKFEKSRRTRKHERSSH